MHYHLRYYSPFAARNHMYRKKVKQVDTTHGDMKIKQHEAQQERDTNVRGSPDPWATSTKPSHPVTFISLKITI